MTKLQFLNVFLTERLMLAAQEIYKSVEDTILEYQEEIAIRERENDHLRRRLRDAGIEIWPDRPSMALLEEEDVEHPRREWSPSMGHEERIPIQVKDKRDLPANQGELRGHGSCNASENMFSPAHVANEYVQDGPHTSALPQSQGMENRERDPDSRGSLRHVKAETGGCHRGSVSSNNSGQPLAPVNPNCGKQGTGLSYAQPRSQRSGVPTSEIPPTRPHVILLRCGVCGKCCSSAGRLQEHQRSHTGEKPFRCQICGKGFTQMAHLKVHIRIHTGEKPYSCPVCGKCFSRSDKIKRHLQTHTREGTYFSGQ